MAAPNTASSGGREGGRGGEDNVIAYNCQAMNKSGIVILHAHTISTIQPEILAIPKCLLQMIGRFLIRWL